MFPEPAPISRMMSSLVMLVEVIRRVMIVGSIRKCWSLVDEKRYSSFTFKV